MISKLDMLDRANANLALMDGTAAPVKKIVNSTDLVFGVWHDDQKPDGISTLIIKGQGRLAAIAAGGKPAPAGTTRLGKASVLMSWSAILCESLEHAIAARRVFGEADPK